MWMLLLLAWVAVGDAAVPQEARRGAEIHGRVTDAESGTPLSRVPIHLGRENANEPQRLALTDDEGRFRFENLPAGSYVGLADGRARGNYVSNSLVIGSGPAAYKLPVKAAEVLEVNIALTRTYAIAVRVVDEWGGPLSGLKPTAKGVGRRGGPPPASFRHETDDHGRMRIFGLEPGRYTVCVPMEGPGTSGPPPRGARHESLLTTCYPSAAEADAEVVAVERADVGELEIRMRRGRTFTISGRVVDAAGTPVGNAMLSLARFLPGSSTGWSMRIDQQGMFTATNVQPGEYAITASVGGPEHPEHRREFEAGYLPLTIHSDLDGLVVQLHKGVDVPGRVVVEDAGAEPPAPQGSGLLVRATLVEDKAGFGSSLSTVVGKQRTFTLNRVFGRRRISVTNTPQDWYVKSIQYDGKEVIDGAIEIKEVRNPPTLDVLLSNRGATMTGRVVDTAGNPVRALVLLFRMDGARPDEPYVVQAAASGVFRFGPARGGTYVVLALPVQSSPPQPGDAEHLARLVAAGERVTLGDLEERTVDLRLFADR